MSTITPPQQRSLEQDHSRVRSPLARVRSTIYRYLGLEGLAVAGLFLTMWFWIGLVLDYGIFKAFLFDWVQETPWAARLTLLLLVLSGLVALLLTSVVLRLFREFSDAAMALVLEKRFPEILGDRLITAVELSDPEAARAFGYSPMLVRETIHEAAERVDQVPVSQVFDWKRLVRRGVLIGILSAGLYAVVASGFCVARTITNEGDAMAGFGDFNEVATIWTERNVLLRNTIWPRRAYLEILPFEGKVGLEGGNSLDPTELRIPQGTQPPTLRVRAWKYIISDSHSAEGWRLLTWDDLAKNTSFLGGLDLPALPEGWKPRDEAQGMTIDEVELLLDQFPLRTKADGVDLPAKWSLAEVSEDGDYRPLLWKDLTKEKLAGLDVPAIPSAWDRQAVPVGIGMIGSKPLDAASRLFLAPKAVNLSVDEVEKQLAQAAQAAKPIAAVFDRLSELAAIRQTLDKVSETASDRANRRTVRKLIVPQEVTLVYRSNRATNTSTMKPTADNEFSGTFAELKESVSYTVRGEDYVTARREITVVERPRVDSLESNEERPAYLFYRIAEDGEPEDLRLKRQPLEASKLSVSGDTTTLEVPAGTLVVLEGQLSKPLMAIEHAVDPKDAKNFSGEKPEKVGERGFSMTLPNVRREQRFKFVYTDNDGVTGERKIVIVPRPDTTPRVREFNPDEVIRKGRGNEGYIVAVGCRIPFKGRIGDDNGLARVRYGVKVTPSDFLSEQKVRGLEGIAALPLVGPGGTGFLGTAMLWAVQKRMASAATEESGEEQIYDLPAFTDLIKRNRLEDGTLELLQRGTIASMLATKQKPNFRRLTREFALTPDKWIDRFAETEDDEKFPSRWFKADDFRSPLGNDLPLWKLSYVKGEDKRPLKDPDDTKPQKRFLVEVRLLVDDNYLDGDLDGKKPIPNTGASGESFTFTVVPDNELLSRIAEEEEIKFREMEKAVKPLRDNLLRLEETYRSLTFDAGSVDAKGLTGFIARCDAIGDVLKTSQQDVKSVLATYERIVKEIRVNQLNVDILKKVYNTIYLPLLESDRLFENTQNDLIALRRAMDDSSKTVPGRVESAGPKASQAKKEMQELVSNLNAILFAMEGLSKINDLIQQLAAIERQEADLERLTTIVLERAIRRALEGKD
jgi:hypothetical protein